MALKGSTKEPGASAPPPASPPAKSVRDEGPEREDTTDDHAEAAEGLEVTIHVGDESFRIAFDAETEVINIDEGMRTVASRIAHWGNVYALAEEELDAADAAYRSWRAEATRELLASDGKLAEWKCKAEIEASQGFQLHKLAIARAQRAVTFLGKLIDALKEKSQNLRSIGARARAELEATGMSTPGGRSRREEDRDEEYREASDKMRETYTRSGAGSRRRRRKEED